MLGFEIMHPQQSMKSKTKISVIGSQSCTSNQVKLFLEPYIAFFIQIWFLCLQSVWHQIGISTWHGWAGSSALYIIKLCASNVNLNTTNFKKVWNPCSHFKLKVESLNLCHHQFVRPFHLTSAHPLTKWKKGSSINDILQIGSLSRFFHLRNTLVS